MRIEFDAGGVTGVSCTCAYSWRGWCKHVVAVTLACVYAEPELPAAFESRELPADLDRDQLQAVLRNMAARNPRLRRQIQREIERLRWDSSRSQEAEPGDAQEVERRVGAMVHSLDYLPSAEAYWYVGGVIDQVRQVLGEAQQALDESRSQEALQVLDGLIAALVEEWTVLDDSDGIVSEFWYELDEPLTQALLGAQLSAEKRSYWANSLYSWINELGYYGVDDAFDRALMVAETLGEDAAPLHTLSTQEHPPPPPLVEPLLSVLNRRGEDERYLDVAKRSGQRMAYVLKLIELDRVSEAIEYGHDQAWPAGEALRIVQALAATARPQAVLAFAQQGLYGPGDKVALALWLQEFAAGLEQRDLALEATMEGLQVAPSLDAYLALQELAGEQWSQVRSQALNALRARNYGWTEPGLVDILLHEGLVEDAIAKIGDRPDPRTLARVVDKAIPVRPGWAIRQSLSQAMRMIEPGQPRNYAQAVEWLRRARDAHRAAGRDAEWQKFVAELKTSPHGRKRKLMGMLDNLG